MKRIPIGESHIRIDEESGFLCITDMAGVIGNPHDNIKNWMRLGSTIEFFQVERGCRRIIMDTAVPTKGTFLQIQVITGLVVSELKPVMEIGHDIQAFFSIQ
ncbi:hypothetical protein E1J53_0005510 [Lewinella sp. W8]|nr:hypothetical protein [Lewinella sp. W8]